MVIVLHGVEFRKYRPTMTPEEVSQWKNLVLVPDAVFFVDPHRGEDVHIDHWTKSDHFGLPEPVPHEVGDSMVRAVGRFDDPRQPPEPWRAPMRERIHDAVDVLLPFFADGAQALPPEAAKAAREFRDMFPELCEPGLLPYYKAVAKDFFAWVETVAPKEKMVFPWKVPGAVPPALPEQPRP